MTEPDDRELPPWKMRLSPIGTHTEATKESVLLPLRLAFGAFWLRAGIEHAVRADWWSGDDLRRFIAKQHDVALWFWRPMLDRLGGNSGAVTISTLVVIAELLIGPAILFNVAQVPALRVGVALNVAFVCSGAVNPSVFYLLAEMTLLEAWTDRAMGRKPERARRHIAWQAIAWFALAGLTVPFMRTVQPDELIADPASTLALVAGIYGFVLARRWWIIRRDFNTIWHPPDQGATP